MNKKNLKKSLFVIFVGLSFLFIILPIVAKAQNEASGAQFKSCVNIAFSEGVDAWALIQCYSDKIFSFLAALASTLSLVAIIYAGFLYLTSGGNPEKVKTANNAIRGAIVGLVIVALSFAVLMYTQTIVTGCGNKTIETGEECDDGNVISGDGCSSNCQIE